MQINFVLIA